jgi:hypothetical protein
MKKNLIVAVCLVCATAPLLGQVSANVPLSADEVIARVLERGRQRESLGGGYRGSREYVLDNHRLNKHASMLVSVVCDASGTKQFQVVSEDGWKSANKHVLRKMLQSESDTSAPANQPKTRLNSENYEFRMAATEVLDGRPSYVIEVTPRRSDRYLFRGRVWIDADDFAMARAEGQPAKNPSFWTRSIHFVQQYHKDGVFWFPMSTTSVTDALIFGTTEVSIRYFDYSPLSNSPQGAVSPLRTEVRHANN